MNIHLLLLELSCYKQTNKRGGNIISFKIEADEIISAETGIIEYAFHFSMNT